MVLRVHTTGAVKLRLLARLTKTLKARPLVVAKHGLAAFRNTASHGMYLYVELQPTARSVEYRLRLTAAGR
jgi:hypothetical protein